MSASTFGIKKPIWPLFHIEPFDRLPWWAGYCWSRPELNHTLVAAPLGLNLVLRVLRWAYLFLRHPFRVFDAAYLDDYRREQMKELKARVYVLEGRASDLNAKTDDLLAKAQDRMTAGEIAARGSK